VIEFAGISTRALNWDISFACRIFSMDSGLLTVDDALKYLKISRPTLYALIKEGKIQTVKIGKRTLFDPEDVKKFVEGHKTPAKGNSKVRTA
jgi:excisionase family DNA binding protein